MRKLMLCAVLCLSASVHANAESAAVNAMQAFGLMGTWAGECAVKPSPANNHAIYAVTPSGGVQLTNTFGDDYEDSVYDIVDARPTTPGKFSLRQVLVKDASIVLDVILLK